MPKRKPLSLSTSSTASFWSEPSDVPLLVEKRTALQQLVITRRDFIRHISRELNSILTFEAAEEVIQQQVIRYLDQYFDAAAVSMAAFPSENNMALFAQVASSILQASLKDRPKIIRDTVELYLQFRGRLEKCKKSFIACFDGQRAVPAKNQAQYDKIYHAYQKLLEFPQYQEIFPTLCAKLSPEKVVAEYHDSLSADAAIAPRTSYGTCIQ